MCAHESFSPAGVSLSIIASVARMLPKLCAEISDLGIFAVTGLTMPLTRG
jgi:hypothetical protein